MNEWQPKPWGGMFSRYRVGFDDAFQRGFSSREEAIRWGRDKSDGGRMVWVASGRFKPKLIAAFPEKDAAEAVRRWTERDGSPRKKIRDYIWETIMSG